jgi:hypothetical protein
VQAQETDTVDEQKESRKAEYIQSIDCTEAIDQYAQLEGVGAVSSTRHGR